MKALLILLLTISINLLGQSTEFPVDSVTNKITYSEVVTVSGASKAELFNRIKINLPTNCKKVTENAAEGKYVVKCEIPMKYPAPMQGYNHEGVVNYTVSITTKDGRYKYEITDLTHFSNRGSGGKLEGKAPECGKYTLSLAGWGSIKNQTKTEIPKVIEKLKAGMAGAAAKAVEKKEDNW